MGMHRTHFIDQREGLIELVGALERVSAFALDIETINWWDREAERVSLLQLALRSDAGPEVYLVDALGGVEIGLLRRPLEMGLQVKAIHNAAFDAVKLLRHYGIATSPIHDTMIAARKGGDRECSLKVQAGRHLGITLDKGEQRGDWSRRPLSPEQLEYAALDALCTLLLYERQAGLGLIGDYQLKPELLRTDRARLEYEDPGVESHPPVDAGGDDADLSPLALALLGIVIELDGRYSPEQLTASVGTERVGIAGWLIDRFLGPEQDVEEDDVRQAVERLCRSGLVSLSESRRLTATGSGRKLYASRS